MRSSRRSCWIYFGQPKKSPVLIYEPLPVGYGMERASEPSNKEMADEARPGLSLAAALPVSRGRRGGKKADEVSGTHRHAR